MHKKFLYVGVTVVILLSLLTSCSDSSNALTPYEEMNCRQVAYNSLSDQEKSTIISDWKYTPVKAGHYHLKDGIIHQLILGPDDKLNFGLKDNALILAENQKLIGVIFNTNTDALLGPMIIIVDPKSGQAIGYVLRL